MALTPAVAEDLIVLLEKYPDLTMVQKCIIKSAAAYLVQDEEDRLHLYTERDAYDPRLKLTSDEYFMIPDRIELWDGLPRPKDWETPNRIAASSRASAEMEAIKAEGFSPMDVWNEWRRRKNSGAL